MKTITGAALSAIFVFACGLAAAQVSSQRTDITTVNIPTLVGKKATDLSVLGLHLGMPRPEAEALLAASSKFTAVHDDFFPTRVFVYERSQSGSTGTTLMCLTWEEEMREDEDEPRASKDLRDITVYTPMRPFLQPNFSRVLTKEAVDEKSLFRKRFLGVPSRSKTIVDPTSIGGRKQTTYFYDAIGIEVTLKYSPKGDHVVFMLR